MTSPGSQAYHDVLHRLCSQFPLVQVIEVGVSVQGDGAADEMALAIDIVNRLTSAEIILLVRGGGAPEELASFNDERLARAIFASRIPVVTGVGHETDHTIVDFVADHRAATPSLAAAAAVPDRRALQERIVHLHAQMRHIMQQRIRFERRRWLDANRALVHASPFNQLHMQRRRAGALTRDLERSVRSQIQINRARLTALQTQLSALDPLAVLERGYAVLTDVETGEVVSRAEHAVAGRALRARVADGVFMVRVEEG